VDLSHLLLLRSVLAECSSQRLVKVHASNAHLGIIAKHNLHYLSLALLATFALLQRVCHTNSPVRKALSIMQLLLQTYLIVRSVQGAGIAIPFHSLLQSASATLVIIVARARYPRVQDL
jgi:hypothetical protein